MTITLLLIATNKYWTFVQPLLDSVCKHFLKNHKVRVMLFTDQMRVYTGECSRITLEQILIPPYVFPEATMLRYKIFTSRTYNSDYIFYLDADMLIVGDVGEEILADIIAVYHPGYFNNKNSKGTWEEREESKCFVEPDKRRVYVAGGCQGGSLKVFYKAMIDMRDWIQSDLDKGITPIWQDESAWNRYIVYENEEGSFALLPPSYCMPEPASKRIAWDINYVQPKILALEKPFNRLVS